MVLWSRIEALMETAFRMKLHVEPGADGKTGEILGTHTLANFLDYSPILDNGHEKLKSRPAIRVRPQFTTTCDAEPARPQCRKDIDGFLPWYFNCAKLLQYFKHTPTW